MAIKAPAHYASITDVLIALTKGEVLEYHVIEGTGGESGYDVRPIKYSTTYVDDEVPGERISAWLKGLTAGPLGYDGQRSVEDTAQLLIYHYRTQAYGWVENYLGVAVAVDSTNYSRHLVIGRPNSGNAARLVRSNPSYTVIPFDELEDAPWANGCTGYESKLSYWLYRNRTRAFLHRGPWLRQDNEDFAIETIAECLAAARELIRGYVLNGNMTGWYIKPDLR